MSMTRFFLIGIASIIFLGFGFNDAFAGGPVVNGFVANDPDNRDMEYSVGDSFSIGFDVPTDQTGVVTQANILGNFTFSTNPGAVFSGFWADNQHLLVTVITTGATPAIGVDTVTVLGTTTIRDFAGANIAGGASVLSGNFGEITGGSPKAGFAPPTVGLTRDGDVLVEDGFSYNGNPVDVHLLMTHYPLVSTNVGEENVAKLKIYSPRGIDRLQHAAVGFGLDKNEIFGHSNVVIEWDRLHNGDEKITVIDPENYLADVRVVTSEGNCRASSSELCLIVEFYHTFRQSLEYNIIGTYIWDDKRSGWQNYYNDGIEILGESLNPPTKHQAINKGKTVEITESGTNTAYDQEGNLWTFDKTWKMEHQPISKIDDGISSKGIERNNVRFSSYKEGQNLLAQHLLENTVDGSMLKNKEIEESISYEYDVITRNNDIELQNRISYELERAKDLSADRFVVNEDDEFQKYWKIHQQYLEKNS